MAKVSRAAACATTIIALLSEYAIAKEVVYAAINGYGRLEKFDTLGTPLGGFSIPPNVAILGKPNW
jgi:hypothetical protein